MANGGPRHSRRSRGQDHSCEHISKGGHTTSYNMYRWTTTIPKRLLSSSICRSLAQRQLGATKSGTIPLLVKRGVVFDVGYCHTKVRCDHFVVFSYPRPVKGTGKVQARVSRTPKTPSVTLRETRPWEEIGGFDQKADTGSRRGVGECSLIHKGTE